MHTCFTSTRSCQQDVRPTTPLLVRRRAPKRHYCFQDRLHISAPSVLSRGVCLLCGYVTYCSILPVLGPDRVSIFLVAFRCTGHNLALISVRPFDNIVSQGRPETFKISVETIPCCSWFGDLSRKSGSTSDTTRRNDERTRCRPYIQSLSTLHSIGE